MHPNNFMGKLEHSSYSVYKKTMTINMAQKFKILPSLICLQYFASQTLS